MSTSGGGCGSLDKATKAYMFEYQPPATLDQAAPVQNTWYPVGGELTNAIIYRAGVSVAVANETLELRATVNGETIDPDSFNATAGTDYLAFLRADGSSLVDQLSLDTIAALRAQSLLFHGLSVQFELRKTTALGAGNLKGIVLWGQLSSI